MSDYIDSINKRLRESEDGLSVETVDVTRFPEAEKVYPELIHSYLATAAREVRERMAEAGCIPAPGATYEWEFGPDGTSASLTIQTVPCPHTLVLRQGWREPVCVTCGQVQS